LALAWALLWRGVAYGAADGLLLSAFPILAVFAAAEDTPIRRRRSGTALIGAAALLASLVMTTVYHLGYRDFRSALLARPVAADRLADLAAQPGLAPLADVLQLNDGGLQLDPNQWRRTWFKGGVGSGVFASAYLATTQTGRSYVVAAVAQNPTPPLPEGADLSMLAAIRGAFTLAAQS
jgi:hypothetical protein